MENIISVIVLTYNQEKTIGRTLDSILMQKCHLPIKIELRDDCSNDATDAVCKRFAEKYPSIIRYRQNKQNKGIIDNYFDTLLECRGKYIADCAGDDFWIDPLKLEKEVQILEKHPDVTLVHTAWNNYDEELGKVVSVSHSELKNEITDGHKMMEKVFTQNGISAVHLCTSLYRKEIFLNAYNDYPHFFKNKEYNTEDLQLIFFMAKAGNIAYIPTPTLNYSVNHISASNTLNEEKQFLFMEGINQLCWDLSQEFNIKSKAIINHFKIKIFALYMHAFRSKNKELLNRAKQKQKEWEINDNIKLVITKFIMSNCITWNFMLRIRKVFCLLKRCFS